MAGRGPAPKDPAQRRNRRKETRVDLATASPGVAPPLPVAPNGEPWPPVVQAWYDVWATSPQASQFLSTDWQRLHMLAPQVLAYYSSFDKAVLVEIRLNESLLGATVVDRLRLRMDVATEAEVAPDVSDLTEFRARLTS